jgi:SAM-dependent methyltransferase
MLKEALAKVSSPKDAFSLVKSGLKAPVTHFFDKRKAKALSRDLRIRFKVYQTDNLKSISKKDFSDYIHSQIGVVDAQTEGYSEDELETQRDLSIKFHWGHNHDFGDFQLKGKMGDRHFNLLADFITLFPISIDDFKDKYVFDIGCWTGGTSLLLAALGSKVFAIEEVNKYSDMVSFLTKSFGIEDKVSVSSQSIYSCNSQEFYDRFDIVYYPGVIYHVSDPLISLRILFNSLRTDGMILVESAGINVKEPYCRFDGSRIYHRGSKEELNRSGWNWFMPSPSALYRMMREAGFDDVQTAWHHETARVFGYGKKTSQASICRAGLSVPDIR